MEQEEAGWKECKCEKWGKTTKVSIKIKGVDGQKVDELKKSTCMNKKQGAWFTGVNLDLKSKFRLQV